MALIKVYPNSSTAIQDAVNAANPGDVILVHRGVYREDVQIPSEKSHIRIIADHPHRTVLDGEHVLSEAFALNNVRGVEIAGFTIKNYMAGGIRVIDGSSSRLLHNQIRHVAGESNPIGIAVNNSEGNLIMNNYIERVGDKAPGIGIRLLSVTGTWIIMNRVRNSSSNGIEMIDSLNNAIVNNRITNSKDDGVFMRGPNNNLILHNKIYRNGGNGVNMESANNYILRDKIKMNRGSGIVTQFDHNFAGFNQIEGNRLSGVDLDSNDNDIQDNWIKHNRNNGVLIEVSRSGNLIYDNRIKCNKPRNIEDLGVNNNIFDNKTKK